LFPGLLEPVAQVAADGFQPRQPGWVDPEEGASDTGIFVRTWGPEVAAAGSQRREISPHAPVRQERRRDPGPGRKGPRPREKLAGLKGYVTNLPVSVMPPAEVISCYHDLWHVEQSFRMSKTDLAARPMFVRTRDAIEAHLTIVFTALAIARAAQDRTGLAIRNVIRQLRPLRSASIAVTGTVQVFPPAIEPEQQKIIDDLKNGRDLRH
jgi:hypothetical protein